MIVMLQRAWESEIQAQEVAERSPRSFQLKPLGSRLERKQPLSVTREVGVAVI